MTAKQKAARENFKKVVSEAKKLRAKDKSLTQAQAVKQAWAIYYNKAEKLGSSKPDKKVGALPIDFKGNFLGYRFKVINQYQLDGKVTAQLVEMDPPGNLIAELSGNPKETARVTNFLISSAFSKTKKTKSGDLEIETDYGPNFLDKKDQAKIKKNIEAFVIGLNKEVAAFNSGKDTKTKKSKGLSIKYTPAVKKLAVIDQIKNILAQNQRIMPGGYTLKPGKIRLSGLFDTTVIKDLDKLKKEYFKLAKLYHPDAGGTKEQFQKLQAEYESLLKNLINGSGLSSEEKSNEFELDKAIRDIVDALINLEGINIELIGKWLWISGNTYPVRGELKKAGLIFIKKDGQPFWVYKGAESRGRGNLTIDEIKKKYGSRVIEAKQTRKISGLGSVKVNKTKLGAALKKAVNSLNKRPV